MTTPLEFYTKEWKPDDDKTMLHLKAVINNYRQLDDLVFRKQLEVTLKGLLVAGYSEYVAKGLICTALMWEGITYDEWVN